MASNIPYSGWSVRIISLPASITVNQLAEIFQLSTSRIYIPQIQESDTYFAWINDFVSEKAAKDFIDQWSDSFEFGTDIKCNIREPKNGEAYIHHTQDNVLVSDVKTHQDKTADTQFEFDSSSGFNETRNNRRISNTQCPFNQHPQSNPVLPRPQAPSKIIIY